MNSEKLWKLVCEDLHVTLSGPQYNSWISPLKLVSTSTRDDELDVTLSAPSNFHRGIIEKRYLTHLTESFTRVAHAMCTITLTVARRERSTGVDTRPSAMGPLFSGDTTGVDELGINMQRIGLSKNYTFDTFAVSSSNEMAHAAALAAAKHFGKAYNPLFIYGGVGVGKTHLAQSVAIHHLQENPTSQMIFCMSEEFTNGIIEAIQQKTTRAFRDRYRKVEGLFIDDIQFIAGKTTVQEEFFHTFNAIVKAGGQVVMTSDRPPSEIKDLEARLRSRFEAGLLVDIGAPDFELRSAITLIKAQQHNLTLTIDQARIIAGNIDSARQIEGFLIKLMTQAQLRNQAVDESFIKAILNSSKAPATPNTPPPLRPHEVIKGVSQLYNLTPKDIRGKRRVKHIVKARHIAMYLLRVDFNLPLTEIGSLFSNRDHTSVMHAVDKIMRQLTDSESLRMDLSQVRSTVYAH